MNKYTKFMLNVGDILSRPKFPFVHKGVYLGNGLVLHNSPARGEHVSGLEDFANNQPVSVSPLSTDRRPAAWRMVAATVADPKPYDAFANNCEHTVTRVTEGRKYSAQLWWVGFLLGIGLVTLAVTR